MHCILWISFCLCFVEFVSGVSDEARLSNSLIRNYSKLNVDRVSRPCYNQSETVQVSFGVALINLIDFNEDTNVATFITWERYLWNDILLQWNPEDFGGVDTTHLPIHRIWKPDLVLYSSVAPQREAMFDALAVVASDGTVLYIPHVERKVKCASDSSTFVCKFKYASWTYHGFQLNMEFYDGLEEIDVRNYVAHEKYNLVSHPAVKNVKYYACCEEPYPDLTFTAAFRKRKSSWFGF